MNSVFVEKCTTELLKLYKEQHEVLYGGQHPLCLNVPCLLYLQRKFGQLQETSGGPVPPSLVSLQTLQDHLAKTLSFKLIPDRGAPALPPTSTLSLSLEPFRALQVLQMKRIPLCLVVGLHRLRGQLRVLVLHRCDLEDLEDLVVRCGADNATTLAWTTLRELDISNNRIAKLGNSLQYMHALEKVNFSNNLVGRRPRVSSESSGSSELELSAPAVVTPDQSYHFVGDPHTEGIESIDKVQFLHLGFNKLRRVPRFGSMAKYNLRILNLRNNELVSVEGLEELDNLADLDLTDNLLSKHSSLRPFHNLHHLSVVSLQGNPVSFHPKHRLRTSEHLSYLIDKSTFKLDGKKLSSAEKKVVPTTMTHYSAYKRPIPPPVAAPANLFNTSINGTAEVPVVVTDTPTDGRRFTDVTITDRDQLASNGPHTSITSQNKKSRKTHNAVIVDSDDDQPPSSLPSAAHENEDISDKLAASLHAHMDQGLALPNKHRHKHKGSTKKKKKKERKGSTVDAPVTSVPPLMNQEELKKSDEMRKMMSNQWLQVSVDKSSSATDEGGGGMSSRRSSKKSIRTSSSQHNTSANSSEILSSGTGNSASNLGKSPSGRNSPKSTGNSPKLIKKESKREIRVRHPQLKEEEEALVEVPLDDCEGTFGPKTSSPERMSPVEIDGDHFLVERYESDVEDEGEVNGEGVAGNDRDQVLLSLSDKFLDEIDVNGKFIDRWDLHSLLAVAVESKYWKPSARKMDVLLLHFNLERRDRSRREYVLMEEGVAQAIMDILKPVQEQNEFTLSLGNKLECLKCQRIFDRAQAKEQPYDSFESRYSTSFNRKSVSNLMCPYCHSHILQQSMRSSFKTGGSFGKNSQGSSTNGAAAVADPLPIYSTTSRVHPGFEVEEQSRRTNGDQVDDTIEPRSEVGPNPEPYINGEAPINRPNRGIGRFDVAGPAPGGGAGGRRKTHTSLVDNSPTESTYLRGFDDGSFGETKPATSTSVSERGHQSEATAVAAAASSPPVNDNFMEPWASTRKKPLNPFDDPDFQRYEGNCSPSRQSFGGDSPDEVSGYPRGSCDEEKQPIVFGGGGRVSDNGGSKECRPGKENLVESVNFLDYNYPPDSDPYFPSSDAIATPNHTDYRSSADPFETPGTATSSSVPSRSYLNNAFDANRNGSTFTAESNVEWRSHNRSNSEDLRRIKFSSSPANKKRLSRGFNLQDSDKSLTSVQEDGITSFENGYSRRSSMCSGGSDSGTGSRSDSNSTTNRKRVSHGSSGETVQRGYSSGDTHKISKTKKPASGGDKPKEGSKITSKLSRVFSFGDVRVTPGVKQQHKTNKEHGGHMSGSKSPGGGSSSSSSGGRRLSKKGASSNSGTRSPTKLHLQSSSDGGRERRANSPITIYKDDDPTYIHNSLQLYLDMEVLDSSRQETFKMVFRSSVVRYGEPGELQMLIVISNIRAYMFRVIAPESSEPSKWLKLTNSHSLRKLVYIDHGIAYQYLRVEFRSPACYTFLLRDDKKCKLCSNLLSLCVADTPGSSLRNVGICVFNIEAIRNPDDVLKEVLKSHYDKGAAGSHELPVMERHSPTKSIDNLQLYRLAFRRRQHTPRISPVTLMVTDDSLFLAKENFAHWPLPRIVALPPKEALLPPYLDVEQKDIVDVERIVLDKEQVKFVVLCFFDETCVGGREGGESCQWSLMLPSAECVNKLCDIIKTRWETDFETAVPISYQ